MNKINKGTFFIVLIITVLISLLSVFGFGVIKGADSIRLGIDIRGGVETVYTPKNLQRLPTTEEINAAKAVLESRLDAKNILDREITADTSNGEILLRFPWKSDEKNFDPKAAIAELGETALLTFRSPDGNILIEGKYVKSNSKAVYDEQNHGYLVQIEFNPEGAKAFEEATGQLIGQRMSIFMDETEISAPTVNQKISGGKAVITGMGSMEDAKELSDKINSGALPFSLEPKNFSTISPTLGASALKVMLIAGIVTFLMIAIFMTVYYRLPGLAAVIGLSLQISLQLLVLSVGQITLTLPGIAGIILSVGMGVDANIIISERIKEEIRNKKSLAASIDAGYKRAFSAVFDGNLTTAIVAAILIIFGSGSMLSFGYTLITGVLLNFLSGITASRLMVVSLSKFNTLKKPCLYGQRRNAQ